MNQIKKLIIRTLEILDLEVSRISRAPASHLIQNNIDLVLDVGANSGQFAQELRKSGYMGRIVSFEPLEVAHKHLTLNSNSDPGWVVHPRCAVGDSNKTVTLNVAGNSYSSSVLEMLPTHSNAAPDSIYVGTNLVDQITLDSIFANYVSEGTKVFLKIDTQGYEMQVLNGIKENLSSITGIQIEMSTTPLYRGEKTFETFISFFKEAGFECWLCLPGFSDPLSGRMLQFDFVYYRKTMINSDKM